jgi:hypothetical protein
MLTAIWDHVLRERILDLEFESEDEALSWVSEHSAEWLAGRKPACLRSKHMYASSERAAPAASAAEEYAGSIDLGKSFGQNLSAGASNGAPLLPERRVSHTQIEVHLEAQDGPSAAMPESFDVTSSRVKQLTGVIYTYRRERTT